MPETLCIAELADGRRALAYIDAEDGNAQIVVVLRPEDLTRRHYQDRQNIQAQARSGKLQFMREIIEQAALEGRMVIIPDPTRFPEIVDAQPLDLPPIPPRPRISLDQLIDMGKKAHPFEPKNRQDQILRDIDNLQRGDESAGL